MKKLIFGGFAVLLAFALITCDGDTPNVITGGDDYLDWEDGGTSFTLYLDGSTPVANASRALTKAQAQASSNFYEVVFYHKTATMTTPLVARASWKRGERASVSNVPRGVDYDSAGPTVATVGDGSFAVIFLGREDGTLLAVGTLASTDTLITPATSKVTFEVVALEATLRLPADDDDSERGAANDAFLTNATSLSATATAATTTILKTAKAGAYRFPVYAIPTDTTTPGTQDVLATYGIGPATLTAALRAGIRLVGPAAPGQSYAEIATPPEFSTSGGVRAIGGDTAEETTATITGLVAGAAFSGSVAMTITAEDYTQAIYGGEDGGREGGLCSLTFSVPVYAITTQIVAGVSHKEWYIRPGFGVNQYYLDNGTGTSNGGSILLAVGEAVINTLDVLTTW